MEPLQRPAAPRSVVEHARAWIDWFGIGRIVASAVAVMVVVAAPSVLSTTILLPRKSIGPECSPGPT